MSLAKWDPFKELRSLRDEMNRIFENSLARWGSGKKEGDWVADPKVDIYQTDKEVVVTAEIPGLESKDGLEVMVDEEQVTIKGEFKRDKEVKEEDYFLSERQYGSFYRSIPLPVAVKTAEAKANYNNGVLEVKIPRAEEAKKKGVKVPVE